MNKSRLMLRIVLVLVLMGVLYLTYRSFVQNQPEFYWDKAQASLKLGKLEHAKIHLQNLTTKIPTHDRGHELLAQVYLMEAKEEGRDDTYAANPTAFRHLYEAGNLRPDDQKLQLKLLEECLENRRMASAAVVARRVIKKDPKNADAVFVLAWEAVDGEKQQAAEKYLDELRDLPEHPVFPTLALEAQLYRKGDPEGARYQRVLSDAVDKCANASTEQLKNLSSLDRDMLVQLLVESVRDATDSAKAQARAIAAVTACEKFTEALPDKKPQFAHVVSMVAMVLENKHPLGPKDEADKDMRNRLRRRANILRNAVIEAGEGTPLVYHQAALTSFVEGDHEKAAEILKQGLEVGAKLPDDQKKQLLELHLLAARNYLIMRKFESAKSHLDVLMTDEDSAGWGYLLAGGLQSAEGRHDKALNSYLQARKSLGDTIFIRMALANCYMAKENWKEALPLLKTLQDGFDADNAEERYWAQQNNAHKEQVHWSMIKALLALDRNQEVNPHLVALRGTPLESSALVACAKFLWEKGDRRGALGFLAQSRERLKDDLALLHLQTSYLQELGQGAAAGNLVAATDDKDSLPNQLYAVRFKMKNGEHEAALAQLREMEQKFPDYPQPLILKAQALLALGRHPEAAVIAETLLKEEKTQTVGRLIAAAAALKMNNLEAAQSNLDEAADMLPGNGGLQMLRGKVAINQGDFDTAVKSFSEVLDVNRLSEDAGNLFLRSIVMLAQREGVAVADARLDEIMLKHPGDPILLIARANLRMQQGRSEQGMELLEQVIDLEPDNPRGHYLKAVAWAQRKRYDTSLASLQKSLTLDPKHVPSHMLAAEIFFATDDFKGALRHSQAALDENPDMWKMYALQVEAHKKMKNPGNAEKVLKDVLQEKPDAAFAYRLLAKLYEENNLIDKAAQTYALGASKNPDEFGFTQAAITMLAKNNRPEDARALARKAVDEKAEVSTYLGLATAFTDAEQFDDARSWARRAMALSSGNDQLAAHLILGNIAIKQAKVKPDQKLWDEARENYAIVLAKFPRNVVAGNNMAWLLTEKFGEHEQALEIAKNIRGETPIERLPSAFLDTLSLVYRRSGRLDEARQVLEHAVSQRPDEALLHYQLGMVLSDAKRPSAARSSLERSLQLGLEGEQKVEAQQVLKTLN